MALRILSLFNQLCTNKLFMFLEKLILGGHLPLCINQPILFAVKFTQAWNLKLLIHKYPKLHSNMTTANRGAGRTPLDWDSRVKIALGTARGISHLHSVGGPKFIHGNIKSTNVLLSQDHDGCIAD